MLDIGDEHTKTGIAGTAPDLPEIPLRGPSERIFLKKMLFAFRGEKFHLVVFIAFLAVVYSSSVQMSMESANDDNLLNSFF